MTVSSSQTALRLIYRVQSLASPPDSSTSESYRRRADKAGHRVVLLSHEPAPQPLVASSPTGYKRSYCTDRSAALDRCQACCPNRPCKALRWRLDPAFSGASCSVVLATPVHRPSLLHQYPSLQQVGTLRER